MTIFSSCPAVAAQEVSRSKHGAALPSLVTSQLKAATDTWVFELGDDGTVLYSRPCFTDSKEGGIEALTGRNFFDELLSGENIKYWENFDSFVRSEKRSASFVWTCPFFRDNGPTKVLMTRAFQRGGDLPKCTVMLELHSHPSEMIPM